MTNVSVPTDTAEPQRSTAVAGVGGIGGGTLLVVIAESLPDGHWAKPFLYWAAPTASVTLTAVWIWIQRRVVRWDREREQRTAVMKAKAVLTQALANPQTTSEHRDRLRSQLEALELLEVEDHMERIRLIIRPQGDAPG
jgi:hypothetical protein